MSKGENPATVRTRLNSICTKGKSMLCICSSHPVFFFEYVHLALFSFLIAVDAKCVGGTDHGQRRGR